jgi:hypothetical protein
MTQRILIAVVVAVVIGSVFMACTDAPPAMVWVDGFAPENVSFDVEDLGALDDTALAARAKSADIDGVIPVEAGACGDAPCRATLVSIYVNNRTGRAEAPPVLRLSSPPGKPRRLPIAFRAHQIDPGRTGRVRTIVQLWPGEERLELTLSSSVQFEVSTTPTTLPPTLPTTPSIDALALP